MTDPGDSRPHELVTFLRQDAAQMQDEYERIFARSREDPGTAGDEGEEIWAQLLRSWLPEEYEIVTKGRLLSTDGEAGPQMDVIVLTPGYPKRLVNKKLYLLGGVVAAFECKNTLKPEHIKAVFEKAARIASLEEEPANTPFEVVVPPIYYGLLAHGTVWTSDPRQQRLTIDQHLIKLMAEMTDPRGCPALICVSNVGCWSAMRMTYDGPGVYPGDLWEARQKRTGMPSEGSMWVALTRYTESLPADQAPPNALSAAIAAIFTRLSFSDPGLWYLTRYFLRAGLQGSGSQIAIAHYPLNIYPEEVRKSLPTRLTTGLPSTEWDLVFTF